MHISNLEVLMEFVGVFLVFSVSIKCCRAGDGITLLAALLVLASRLLSIKSLSSTMLFEDSLLSLRLSLMVNNQLHFTGIDASTPRKGINTVTS